jgi:Uma2 family endonuclease
LSFAVSGVKEGRDMAVFASNEIVFPDRKPYTEWVRGRPLKKMGAVYRHGRLQSLLAQAMSGWARGRGRVALEWRFRVNPPGEVIRPLVPDVAYLSYEAVAREDATAAQTPLGAPTVAVEVLSRGDLRADVEDKIATYLRAGSAAVVIVDPGTETIAVHERAGVSGFAAGTTLTLRAMPGFALDVGELFALSLE